jgi:hypothetical protein
MFFVWIILAAFSGCGSGSGDDNSNDDDHPADDDDNDDDDGTPNDDDDTAPHEQTFPAVFMPPDWPPEPLDLPDLEDDTLQLALCGKGILGYSSGDWLDLEQLGIKDRCVFVDDDTMAIGSSGFGEIAFLDWPNGLVHDLDFNGWFSTFPLSPFRFFNLTNGFAGPYWLDAGAWKERYGLEWSAPVDFEKAVIFDDSSGCFGAWDNGESTPLACLADAPGAEDFFEPRAWDAHAFSLDDFWIAATNGGDYPVLLVHWQDGDWVYSQVVRSANSTYDIESLEFAFWDENSGWLAITSGGHGSPQCDQGSQLLRFRDGEWNVIEKPQPLPPVPRNPWECGTAITSPDLCRLPGAVSEDEAWFYCYRVFLSTRPKSTKNSTHAYLMQLKDDEAAFWAVPEDMYPVTDSVFTRQ